jgi:hypothetical protein
MSTYNIFIKDLKVNLDLDLEIGTMESLDTARELIKYQLEENPSLESGYIESYPFFKGNWNLRGLK